MAQTQTGTNGGGGFMGHAQRMLDTHPGKASGDRTALLQCIQACFDCEQTCIACADACLAEDKRDMLVRCIRLNQDCANVCEATGKVLSRQTSFELANARDLLQACMSACRRCADECAKHAQMHEHCRVCEEACRKCEQACSALSASA